MFAARQPSPAVCRPFLSKAATVWVMPFLQGLFPMASAAVLVAPCRIRCTLQVPCACTEAHCCSIQAADSSSRSCRRCIQAPAVDAASILRKPSCYLCILLALLGDSTCLTIQSCHCPAVASEAVRDAGGALGEKPQSPRRQMESGDGAMPRQRRTADTSRRDRFGGDRFGMQSRSAWHLCPGSISDEPA